MTSLTKFTFCPIHRIDRHLPLAVILAVTCLMSSQANSQDIQTPDTTIRDYTEKLTPLQGTTPAQWRVTWHETPATSAVLSWSTADEGTKHIAYYDTRPRNGQLASYAHQQHCQRNGQYSGSGQLEKDSHVAKAYYHHARLTGLEPATTYYVTLVSDGIASKELHFTTAHADGSNFSILVGGDSRSGHLRRCHMNAMMANMLEADADIMALAHGGDFVGTGTSWKQWRLWLSQHELTTSASGRILPIIPTRGNHDGGPLLAEVFDFPPGTPIDYTTRLSKDVALITLNRVRKDVLEGWLRELRPQTRWLLAQYHRPIYPAVKKPSGTKRLYAPLFEHYNLDLACESDGHCIKRTVPIRGDKMDPTGVTYIGEGSLGVGQYRPKIERWYIQKPRIVSRGSHVFRLDFTRDTLRMRVVVMGGSIFDDHRLQVRSPDVSTKPVKPYIRKKPVKSDKN